MQARIEHLEDENAALRAELKLASSVTASPGSKPGVLAMIVLAAVIVGGGGYLIVQRQTPHQARSPASEGIATAPLDPAPPPPLPLDKASPRARPGAPPVPKGTAKPCDCAVGDPLCNCL